MADIKTKKITDLPEKTEISDTDLIAVGNAGTASLRKTKWSTFWNRILSKIRSDVIVNNKTTTASGYAADARVAKDLQDQLTKLNTDFSKLSNDLITGTPLSGAELNKYNERTVPGLENFDEVKIFIEIGDAVKQWLYFDRSITEQAIVGWGGNNYYSIVSFKCDLNTGVIGVKVRSTVGWTLGNSSIKQVRTVRRK